ncbi:MAG: hypothetical protein ACREHG_10190 [Candidatus Saccharimonadales bacterium]
MPKSFDKKIAKAKKTRHLRKIRTVEIKGHPGEYAHIYVFNKAGSKGGHTLESPPKRRKGSK